MKRLFLVASIALLLMTAITPAAYADAPVNDNCSGAKQITGTTYTDTMDTTSATTAVDDPAVCAGSKGNTVWYVYTAGANGIVTADTFGSDYDTVLAAYTGTCGAFIPVDCNDDSSGGPQSSVTINVTAGTTYYFMVASYDNPGGGNLVFNFSFGSGTPVNDECSGAKEITSTTYTDTMNTVGATTAADDPPVCSGYEGNTVWYKYTADTNETVTADTFGSDYDTVLAAYTGTCGSFSSLACNDDSSGAIQSSVTIDVTAGTTYYFMVAGYYNPGGGNLVFNFSLNPGMLSVTPSTGLDSSGLVGGPFSPPSQSYTLTNTGGQPVNWAASNMQPWASLSSASGSLAAGESTTVTVSINSEADSLGAGSYSDTVSFVNTTNGNGDTTRPVSLVANAPAGTPGSLEWSYTTGDVVYASPAIGSDGTVYVGSEDGKLYAINPDGSLKWNYTTGNVIYSSPAIGSDGTVYVGSTDYKLYAINPDGSLKWSYTAGDWVDSSPAIGGDGTVYVGSDDGKLYAINPDGSLKWSYTTTSYVFSSPAIGSDGTVYVGSDDKKLYAINPDGSLKWSYTTGDWVESSPAIGSDGTVYVGSDDGKLYAINPDGSLKWSYTTSSEVISSPAIGSDGTIYVGSSVKLYAINPDGSLKWSHTMGSFVDSSPAIGSDGTVYVGSDDGKLYAINSDGSLKWNYTTGDWMVSCPAITGDESNGMIYVGSYDGKLYAVNGSSGLANTPWPMFRQNVRHTGVRFMPAKIGVFDNGYWYLDSNMSWAWDGTPTDTLGIFGIGLTGAVPVVGDWNGNGTTKIGVFMNGYWYLDMNRNWQWDGEPTDKMGVFGVGLTGAIPVVGDWKGDGTTRIGVFINGVWYLDMNNNWQWDGEPTDKIAYFGVGLTGAVPVVGDWNGDGKTKIGIYQNGYWYLDVNGNGQWDGEQTDQLGVFGVGLTNAVPVVGDWNADGIDEIGIYQQGYWYLDKNRSWQWEGEPTDQFGVFGVGLTGAVPVPGKW